MGANVCKELSSQFDVYGTYFAHQVEILNCRLIQLDLTEGINALNAIQPEVIIHCAAESNVDVCESRPEQARRSILMMTKNVIAFAKQHNAFLIHISTDALFDGNQEYQSEDSPINTINVYSKYKAEAENYINKHYKQSCIIRSRFYGWNILNKQCFTEQIISLLRQGKEIMCYEDSYSTQIMVRNLIDVIREIIRERIRGVINIVESKRMSRYEFARLVADVFELPGNLIKPILFKENTHKTKRAQDTSLSNKRALSLLKTPILTTEEGLREMKLLESCGYKEALKNGK